MLPTSHGVVAQVTSSGLVLYESGSIPGAYNEIEFVTSGGFATVDLEASRYECIVGNVASSDGEAAIAFSLGADTLADYSTLEIQWRKPPTSASGFLRAEGISNYLSDPFFSPFLRTGAFFSRFLGTSSAGITTETIDISSQTANDLIVGLFVDSSGSGFCELNVLKVALS